MEEAGTLTLGARRGVLNVPLEATLTDPDTVAGETWKWQRSTSGTGSWMDIANTDSTSYTPGAADRDNYLRASVTYTDGTGPDETTLAVATGFPTVNDASTNLPPTPPDPIPQVPDVAENTPGGRNVVQVVLTDPEGEQPLRYTLSGSDEFGIGSSTGWIFVRRGGLNYEESPSHSVTVRAADSFGAAATVTLTIGISDVNEPPEAVDLAVKVAEDETVDIDVVGEATDQDAGDTLTVAGVVSSPHKGSTTVNVGTNDITYTPQANYHGSDNFTYRVNDAERPALERCHGHHHRRRRERRPGVPCPRRCRTLRVGERDTETPTSGAPVVGHGHRRATTLTYSLLGAGVIRSRSTAAARSP